MTDREHQIRERAYSIWEAEGHPHGHADDHWHRAAREIEHTGPDAAPAEAGAAVNGAAAELADAAAPETPAPRRRKTAATTGSTPRKRAVKKS